MDLVLYCMVCNESMKSVVYNLLGHSRSPTTTLFEFKVSAFRASETR